MNRQIWTFIHRYVGLVIAGFLLVAGLTGTLLAWYNELDQFVAADLYSATSSATVRPLDPFALREKVEAAYPNAVVNAIDLSPPAPGKAAVIYIEGVPNPLTKKTVELLNDEIFIDPTTGNVIGERKWGAISQGMKNLMPFIYLLHYSLALGVIGSYAFGIAALLWTMDCFVGAYLTFPTRVKKRESSAPRGKGWWSRWQPAWLVRWRSGSYKVNFDLHRAGGLWVWAMLFVLAWSGVAFNLNQVYKPVMKVFFTLSEEDKLPKLNTPQVQPGITWRDAHALAQQHAAAISQKMGFIIAEERRLSYDASTALYHYQVKSSADVNDKYGGTELCSTPTPVR